MAIIMLCMFFFTLLETDSKFVLENQWLEDVCLQSFKECKCNPLDQCYYPHNQLLFAGVPIVFHFPLMYGCANEGSQFQVHGKSVC